MEWKRYILKPGRKLLLPDIVNWKNNVFQNSKTEHQNVVFENLRTVLIPIFSLQWVDQEEIFYRDFSTSPSRRLEISDSEIEGWRMEKWGSWRLSDLLARKWWKVKEQKYIHEHLVGREQNSILRSIKNDFNVIII